MAKYGLVRAAVNTSTGTQEFRDSNMDETPNCAIFIISGATANDTAVDEARIGVGATDGTNQFALSSQTEHNQTTSDSDRRARDDSCIMVLAVGSVNGDGRSSFSSWLSDTGSGAGVEINHDVAYSSGFLLTVLLFKFENVQVGNFAEPSSGTPEDVSTSFESNIFITFGMAGSVPGNNPHFNMAAGITVDDSGIVKRALGTRDRDGVNPSQAGGYISNANSHIVYNNTSNAVARSYSVTSFDATSVEVSNDSGTPTTQEIGYIAIRSLDDFKLIDLAAATSTGNDAITGVGFQPEFGFGVQSRLDLFNTVRTGDRAGTFALGAFTENDEYCTCVAFQDAVSPTNTESYTDDNHSSIKGADGTKEFEASIVSLDSDGWTRNVATAESSATQNFWLVLAESAAAEQFMTTNRGYW